MSLITQLIGLIGIGLLTGSVVGLTGASGVVVVVPLLTVLSVLNPAKTHSLTGIMSHRRGGKNWSK